jgi:hypothetical protein
MATDFRSDRMDSPDGIGQARKAWDAYSNAVNRVALPFAKPVIDKVAAGAVVDLMGFWLVWQLEGGYEGLRKTGMSRSAIYRRISLFRRATGYHPDVFEMPGVSIDVASYLAGSANPAAEGAKKK